MNLANNRILARMLLVVVVALVQTGITYIALLHRVESQSIEIANKSMSKCGDESLSEKMREKIKGRRWKIGCAYVNGVAKTEQVVFENGDVLLYVTGVDGAHVIEWESFGYTVNNFVIAPAVAIMLILALIWWSHGKITFWQDVVDTSKRLKWDQIVGLTCMTMVYTGLLDDYLFDLFLK